MAMAELLQQGGLTEKEVSAYLALLKYGLRPTSFIAKKAGLNRGTTWVVLHSLTEKGLVAKMVKKNVQYFSALSPERLLAFLHNREQHIRDVRTRAEEMLPQLLALANPHSARPKIEYFEGVEGARYVLESTLSSKEKRLRAFLSLADTSDFVGDEFLEDYTKRRISTGLKLEALRTREKDKLAMQKNIFARKYHTGSKYKRVVRYVPEDLSFPITMYLYDEKIALISSPGENFALVIESRELSEMQKKLFQLVWDNAAPDRT